MTAIVWLTFAALVCAIGSLVSGVISMAHGGRFDSEHATHFMFARVGFQALTVLLLMQLAYLNYV